MESLPAINDAILVAIGENNIQFEKYEEDVLFDIINDQLTAAQNNYRAKYEV